jgi:hypothetical protein
MSIRVSTLLRVAPLCAALVVGMLLFVSHTSAQDGAATGITMECSTTIEATGVTSNNVVTVVTSSNSSVSEQGNSNVITLGPTFTSQSCSSGDEGTDWTEGNRGTTADVPATVPAMVPATPTAVSLPAVLGQQLPAIETLPGLVGAIVDSIEITPPTDAVASTAAVTPEGAGAVQDNMTAIIQTFSQILSLLRSFWVS